MLEEEIKKWQRNYANVLVTHMPIDLKDIEIIALHFAQWQKQHMMKDAMECTWGSQATSSFMGDFPNIECGDKVKIIIVKED